MSSPLPAVGELAPDFELPDQHGTPLRLSSYRGSCNVLLVFFPWSFSGVCTGELRALVEGFATDGVQLLGVSADSVYAQRTFADREGVLFPLLSDFWPHGEVARSYGVFDEQVGVALRGSFIVDRAGVLRWSVLRGTPDARDPQQYRDALAELG